MGAGIKEKERMGRRKEGYEEKEKLPPILSFSQRPAAMEEG